MRGAYMCGTCTAWIDEDSWAWTDAATTPDEQPALRRVEFHILLSLAAGERHGYGIIQDIEARGETRRAGRRHDVPRAGADGGEPG